MTNDFPYQTKFANWDAKAWIKQGPGKGLGPVAGTEYFPALLFPAADHPLVLARGPEVRSTLLVKRLYGYARFTALLERHVVNPVTLLLADNELPLELPGSMRADGDLIYTDEAGHALESNRIIARVASLTGVSSRDFAPAQLQTYFRLIDAQAPELRALFQLAFGIVSETLISSTLSGIPRDPTVQPLVQWYTGEHAIDEGRHHNYFAQVLDCAWPQLTRAQKEAVAPMVPKFMTTFLGPDLPLIVGDLQSLGFSAAETEQIMAEKVVTQAARDGIRASVQKSMGYFREVGALELPGVQDAFWEEGLL